MKTVTGQYLPPTDIRLVEKLFRQCQEEYRQKVEKEIAGYDRAQVRLLLHKPQGKKRETKRLHRV